MSSTVGSYQKVMPAYSWKVNIPIVSSHGDVGYLGVYGLIWIIQLCRGWGYADHAEINSKNLCIMLYLKAEAFLKVNGGCRIL